jgi:lipopolysaccharide export system permease protein
LANLATLLGGKGLLDPLWAAVMPNLTMIGVGTYLFGRMR